MTWRRENSLPYRDSNSDTSALQEAYIYIFFSVASGLFAENRNAPILLSEMFLDTVTVSVVQIHSGDN
jgi:hypothetical protein